LRKKAALDAALNELETLNRVRVVQHGKQRLIQIHPALLMKAASAIPASSANEGAAKTLMRVSTSKNSNNSSSTPMPQVAAPVVQAVPDPLDEVAI